MLIYALQSFTATDGTVCTAKSTYTVTDAAGQAAIMNGQAQRAEMPGFFAPVDANSANTAVQLPGGVPMPIGGVPCEGYGASASASASVNAAAINAAMAAGGLVTLTTPGTYSVGASLVIPDNTEFVIGKGVVIQRAASVNAPLLKNRYESYLLTNADLSKTASSIVVVNDHNHTRTVGETVIVGQCQTANYNGVVTVTAVTQHTWSYDSGVSATNTGGGATYYATIIPVRSTVLAAKVVGASNYVTVTDAALASKLKPGDDIWVGSTSGSDTNFVGQKTVATVNPGVSFSYYSASAGAAPTGSLLFNFNVGITLSGQGQLDGNRANQSSPGSGGTLGMRISTVSISMVSRFRVNDGLKVTGAAYRALSLFNCSNVELDYYSDDTLVTCQFEGSARNVRVNRAKGESTILRGDGKWQHDDFIAFTGTHYIGGSGYDNVTSPYGLGNFYDITLEYIEIDNCFNGVKITAYSTVTYKNFKIRKLIGRNTNPAMVNGAGTVTPVAAAISIIDDTAALTGCVVNDLEVDDIVFSDANPSAALSTFTLSNTGANGRISVGRINDNANVGAMLYVAQGAGSTKELVLNNQYQFFDQTSNTKPRYLFASGTVGKVIFDGTFIPPSTNGATVCTVQASATVKSIEFSGVYGGNSSFSGTPFLSIAGTVSRVIFDKFTPGATAFNPATFILYQASGGTTDIYVNDSEIAGNSFAGDGGGNIGAATLNYFLNGCKWTPGGNNFIQFAGSASVHNVYGGTNNSLPSSVYLSTVGTQVANFYCEAARIDITTNARIGKPMGAKVWNTNAALGTLGAAGPVISDGTSWHLMTDTTKLY